MFIPFEIWETNIVSELETIFTTIECPSCNGEGGFEVETPCVDCRGYCICDDTWQGCSSCESDGIVEGTYYDMPHQEQIRSLKQEYVKQQASDLFKMINAGHRNLLMLDNPFHQDISISDDGITVKICGKVFTNKEKFIPRQGMKL